MIYAFLTAYLLGTIPFGLFIARAVKGIDIRDYGSKNIGATNVFRVVGRNWGIACLILDASKGWFACTLPSMISGQPYSMEQKLILAIAAIVGHTFPVWLKFKGGKGVATSLGVFLAAAPVPTLLTFGFWILIFSISRIISVASLSAGLFYPACVFLLMRSQAGFAWIMGLSLLLSAFMFYTHRANIGRLRRGEEKKLF